MEQKRSGQSLLEFVRAHGIARSGEIEAAGFPRVLISRMVRRGELHRVGRGIYSAPGSDLTEWNDLAEVAKSIPNAVISLISALAYHEIGTQVPYAVWVTLPAGSWEPIHHLPLRVTRWSEPYYSSGIEERVIQGVKVRVYGPAKSVADCFRMRSKVGYDVAVEAMKEGLSRRRFTLEDLYHYARVNRVERVMRPYIEALTS